MPILSKLRTTASAGVRFAQALVKTSRQTNVPVREMGGGGHKMIVRPSEFQKHRVLDDVLYFMGLGLIPLGLVTLYANVRIGPAELADTPEGYIPEQHEYHRYNISIISVIKSLYILKLPVTRFMAKYITNNTVEKFHERTLYYLHKANEKKKQKTLKNRIKQEQKENPTQKGWYYIPMAQDSLQTRIEKAKDVHPIHGAREIEE